MQSKCIFLFKIKSIWVLVERWGEDVDDDRMQNTWQASINLFEIQKRKNTHTHIHISFACVTIYQAKRVHLKIKISSAVSFLCLSKLFIKQKMIDKILNQMETLYWNKNSSIFYLHLVTSRDSIFYFIYRIIIDNNNDLCY